MNNIFTKHYEMFNQYFKIKNPILIKGVFVLFVLILVLINSLTGLAIMWTEVECIDDYFHIYTNGINTFFIHNVRIKYMLMVVLGIMQDFIFLVFGIVWINNNKTFRFIYCVIALFLLKLVFIFVFSDLGPSTNLNEYPGFPSILNDYSQSSLYFSFEIGLLLLFYFEFSDLGMINLSKLCIIVIAFASIMKIAIRMNYCIDVIFGLIFAHYIYEHFLEYSIIIDNYVFRRKKETNLIELINIYDNSM